MNVKINTNSWHYKMLLNKKRNRQWIVHENYGNICSYGLAVFWILLTCTFVAMVVAAGSFSMVYSIWMLFNVNDVSSGLEVGIILLGMVSWILFVVVFICEYDDISYWFKGRFPAIPQIWKKVKDFFCLKIDFITPQDKDEE